MATKREKLLIAHLSGYKPLGLPLEELDPPLTDIEVATLFHSLKPSEMRKLMGGQFGRTFQTNVNNSLEKIFKETK
jgi:hypothetical protein